MPPLEPIAALLLEFRREGRDAFLKAHTSPFLLVLPSEINTEGTFDDGCGGFNTETFRFKRLRTMDCTDEELDAASKAKGVGVVEISKSADSPWRGRVSLGRARNNDLVLSGAGVSKLHAHFTTHDTGTASIADAGSHNGTLLNGTKLARGKNVTVEANDNIAFGDVKAVFHTPTSMCAFLESLFSADPT